MTSGQDRCETSADRVKDAAGYANYFKVRMNPFDLMMEFGQFHTEDPEPLIHMRVVTTPQFGKVFMNLLADSIHDFEAASGIIESPPGWETWLNQSRQVRDDKDEERNS
jgi:hypothetical protein